jgi:hypothetical protein
MPLLKTFGEIKQSRAIQVASACKDSDEFASLINEATDILLQRGDWPGTILPMRLMVRNGCVVWPRCVQKVRRINRCGMPLKVGSIWWDFVDHNDYLGWQGAAYYLWGGTTITGEKLGHYYGQGNLISQGRVPTYNDVPSGNPVYIRAYALGQVDKGKTVTIFGIDGNGQTLRHQDPVSGDWLDGAIITLDIPFGSTSTYVQRIDAVLKDETQFNVPLYSYDPITNTLLDLAIYEPTETNPSYSKDRLFSVGSPNCQSDFTIIALVKLAFIPVKVDTDYVLIPSTNALKKAIQSIKHGEAGDIANQEAYLQSAVNELNMVMENEQPLSNTPVDSGFMGEAQGVGYQHCL